MALDTFKIPTDEEWDIISRFVLSEEVRREDIGVISIRVANNDRNDYDSLLSEGILKNFEMCLNNIDIRSKLFPGDEYPDFDLPKIVRFNLFHPKWLKRLPIGSSFYGELKSVPDKLNVLGDPLLELYGKYYVVQDSEELVVTGDSFDQRPVSMSIKEIAKKINTGILRKASVGFYSRLCYCSTCGGKGEYGTLFCDHVPGAMYKIDKEYKLCLAVIGVDGVDSEQSDGVLEETSLVLEGTIPSAAVVSNFSRKDSNDKESEIPTDKEKSDKKTDLDKEENFYYTFELSNLVKNKPTKQLGGTEMKKDPEKDTETNDSTDSSEDKVEVTEFLKNSFKSYMDKLNERIDNFGTVLDELSDKIGTLQENSTKESTDLDTEAGEKEQQNENPLVVMATKLAIKAFGQEEGEKKKSEYAAMSRDELEKAIEDLAIKSKDNLGSCDIGDPKRVAMGALEGSIAYTEFERDF